LNENLKEMETIRKDPENYIYEYFGELTRQVDLRRETLIRDIHEYSDELIQKIEKLKQERAAKSKEGTIITDDLEMIKTKMNDLNSMFNSSDIDDIKHGKIISQKKLKEVSDLMGLVLNQYKYDLQDGKYYNFFTNEIKLENVFGSLSFLNYDIGNIKVNIV